jgi:hypothetical protein
VLRLAWQQQLRAKILTVVELAVFAEHLPTRMVWIAVNQPLLVCFQLGQVRGRQLVIDICDTARASWPVVSILAQTPTVAAS